MRGVYEHEEYSSVGIALVSLGALVKGAVADSGRTIPYEKCMTYGAACRGKHVAGLEEMLALPTRGTSESVRTGK